MAATLATVEAYLTSAQTSLSDGDYTGTRKYILLGQIELCKLPNNESDQGTAITLREGFDKIMAMLDKLELDANRGTRRSYLSEI